jgi:hypothetical protein
MLETQQLPFIKNETEVRTDLACAGHELAGPAVQPSPATSQQHSVMITHGGISADQPPASPATRSFTQASAVFCFLSALQRQLLLDLSEQGEAVKATLKQLQQVQQLHATYKVTQESQPQQSSIRQLTLLCCKLFSIGLSLQLPLCWCQPLLPAVCCLLQTLWSQLLICRRSNLMSVIPLTGQRLEQLSAAAASLASVLQTQLTPLQPQIDRLAVFASANRSTAEELQLAGAATSLVRIKLLWLIYCQFRLHAKVDCKCC